VTEIVPIADVTQSTVPAALHGGVVTIGNFDGVHHGHACLLRQARELADSIGGPTIACLFDPHPIAILRPEAVPKQLTRIPERARRMQPLGIDYLAVCQTSRDLLSLSPEAFFGALVRDRLRCRGMVEGENFRFGQNRAGDVTLLRMLCERYGIEFELSAIQATDGEPVSSTRIRDLLADGDVAAARRLMAAPHRVSGTVSRGDGRGRTIGFPTANLVDADVVVPAAGVYAGIAWLDDTPHQAAIHVGLSPTFQAGQATQLEVHLIDFSGELYGRTLRVDFIDRVREVVRFDSADALVHQLQDDIQTARQLLDSYQPNEL
jgi:riboflavin kinase/FMN adenylyltransferase